MYFLVFCQKKSTHTDLIKINMGHAVAVYTEILRVLHGDGCSFNLPIIAASMCGVCVHCGMDDLICTAMQ